MNRYINEEGLLTVIPNINEQFENCILTLKLLGHHEANVKRHVNLLPLNEIKYCYNIYVKKNNFHIFALYFYSSTNNIFVNFTSNTKSSKSYIWKGPIRIENKEQLEQILNRTILEN
jgi:hypothetical protein